MYAVVGTYLYYRLLSRLIQLRKSSIDIIVTEFFVFKILYYLLYFKENKNAYQTFIKLKSLEDQKHYGIIVYL